MRWSRSTRKLLSRKNLHHTLTHELLHKKQQNLEPLFIFSLLHSVKRQIQFEISCVSFNNLTKFSLPLTTELIQRQTEAYNWILIQSDSPQLTTITCNFLFKLPAIPSFYIAVTVNVAKLDDNARLNSTYADDLSLSMTCSWILILQGVSFSRCCTIKVPIWSRVSTE